jgi:PBSX family phage terminase large subunit
MNVAEGAIRSGKTIDHCIIAAMYLELCPDKIHLASGSTIGNAKLNIGACNGFGLENLFRGRCKWGKFKDNEALYIYTQTGEKIVIFAGGAKADSYKRILGNSYGMWIATEINEHYDCDDSRSSFIKVAFGRQVAAQKPLVLWDLNPCNPQHRIYTDYIDNYLDGYIGGYQYKHFTIDDNLSISPQRKAEIKSQYIVGSIWYRRDILGERCIAEGLVYPRYEEAICKPFKAEYADYVLSVDYGTQNATAVLLWGLYGNVWYCIREYYYSGRETGRQKTDEEYCDDIENTFSDAIQKKQNRGEKIRIIVDPSAASFIAALKRRKKYKVTAADNNVLDGIRDTDTAMFQEKIKIFDTCECLIGELQGYCWIPDSTEDAPVKENDHACVTGDTLVMTESGEKPISELVGTIGKVWSYNAETGEKELKKYNICCCTQKQAKIYRIELADGRIIKCTAEHPILTNRGYVQAQYLKVTDNIIDISDSK